MNFKYSKKISDSRHPGARPSGVLHTSKIAILTFFRETRLLQSKEQQIAREAQTTLLIF